MQNEKSVIFISIPNIQLYLHVRDCLWQRVVKILLNFRVGAAEQTTSDWLTKLRISCSNSKNNSY